MSNIDNTNQRAETERICLSSENTLEEWSSLNRRIQEIVNKNEEERIKMTELMDKYEQYCDNIHRSIEIYRVEEGRVDSWFRWFTRCVFGF